MSGLGELISNRSIIVCAGPGGVGKTTTAASLGLAAAQAGRRAVVITIDPAKRLADALGLAGGLTNEPQQVEGVGPGELWAMMLDPKATFDGVVGRYAATPEQRDRILGNGFYRNVSSKLSGTQEYMAAEKLYDLHHDDRFDLVVIDTPPTRHALDVVDAPRRLVNFLDHRLYRAFVAPARAGFKLANIATNLVLRTVSKVVGGEMIADVVAFFQAFDGMEAGFSARSSLVLALLTSQETAYVVITAPRRDRLAEATWLVAQLGERKVHPAALVINRCHPSFETTVETTAVSGGNAPKPARSKRPKAAVASVEDPSGDARRSDSASTADGSSTAADVAPIEASETAQSGPSPISFAATARAEADRTGDPAWVNLAELAAMAEQESALVGPLSAAVAPAPVVRVPLLNGDVHDLVGLGDVTGYLLGR